MIGVIIATILGLCILNVPGFGWKYEIEGHQRFIALEFLWLFGISMYLNFGYGLSVQIDVHFWRLSVGLVSAFWEEKD